MKIALTTILGAALLAVPPAFGAGGAALTDEQTRQYRETTKLRDEAERPLLDRQRDGLAEVRGLIAAGKSDREVQRRLDDLKEVFGEIRGIEDRYVASLSTFLTPAQRSKLAAAAAAAPKKAPADAKAAAEPRDAAVPGDEEEQE